MGVRQSEDGHLVVSSVSEDMNLKSIDREANGRVKTGDMIVQIDRTRVEDKQANEVIAMLSESKVKPGKKCTFRMKRLRRTSDGVDLADLEDEEEEEEEEEEEGESYEEEED